MKLPSHKFNHSGDFTLVLVLLGQTFQLVENAIIWHRISTEQTHRNRQKITQVAKLSLFLTDKRKLITHYLEIYAAKQWFPVLPGNHHHCLRLKFFKPNAPLLHSVFLLSQVNAMGLKIIRILASNRANQRLCHISRFRFRKTVWNRGHLLEGRTTKWHRKTSKEIERSTNTTTRASSTRIAAKFEQVVFSARS